MAMLWLVAAPALSYTSSPKLKVFVLAGQSNMQGHGLVDASRHEEELAMLSRFGTAEEQRCSAILASHTHATIEEKFATIEKRSCSSFLNGTLEYLVTDPRTKHEFGKLKKGGEWVNRSDVFILYND